MRQLASELAAWPHPPFQDAPGLQGVWNLVKGVAGRTLTGIGAITLAVASEVNIRADLARTLAERYGWFIHGELALPFVLTLSELAQSSQNQRSAINQAFVRYYTEDNFRAVREIGKRWDEHEVLEKRRRRIMRDIVQTLTFHDPPRFNAANVVVPALIAQIDGLLAQFASEALQLHFKTVGHSERRQVAEAFASVIDQHFRFEETAIDLIFNVLYSSAYFGELPQSGKMFSRHKIIHGEASCYGTLSNALRLVLLTDFVITVIQKYHDAGQFRHA